MNIKSSIVGIFCATAFAALVAGCSQTAAPAPNIVERAQGETPAPPPPSGFLGKETILCSNRSRFGRMTIRRSRRKIGCIRRLAAIYLEEGG
jgi:hypothetical protein